MNNSRAGEMVAGVGGLVLLISLLFFDWYNAAQEIKTPVKAEVDIGIGASDAFGIIFWLLLIVAVIAVVLVGARLAGAVAGSVGMALAVIGLVAAVLILFRLIDLPNDVTVDPGNASIDASGQVEELFQKQLDDQDAEDTTADKLKEEGFDFGRSFGIFLGFLAALGIAGGGFASLRAGGAAGAGSGGAAGGVVGTPPGGGASSAPPPPPPPPSTPPPPPAAS